jgi:cytoskeletal protein CcmA (bactofilin family)
MDRKGSGTINAQDFDCRLGEDTEIKGNITGSEDILINGEITGDIDVKAMVYVGENGKIKGTIKANDVVVEGKIEGSLIVQNKIELTESAHINADMECGKLAVTDGAFYEGKVHMDGIEQVK